MLGTALVNASGRKECGFKLLKKRHFNQYPHGLGLFQGRIFIRPHGSPGRIFIRLHGLYALLFNLFVGKLQGLAQQINVNGFVKIGKGTELHTDLFIGLTAVASQNDHLNAGL